MAQHGTVVRSLKSRCPKDLFHGFAALDRCATFWEFGTVGTVVRTARSVNDALYLSSQKTIDGSDFTTLNYYDAANRLTKTVDADSHTRLSATTPTATSWRLVTG